MTKLSFTYLATLFLTNFTSTITFNFLKKIAYATKLHQFRQKNINNFAFGEFKNIN